MEPAAIPSPVVRFGVFEADLRSGELRRSGVRIKMQELPFRALQLFLSRPGEVIRREELRHSLWPDDVHVDFDRGISSAINRLRETLGDTAANPIFLETVERRGYRWIAPTHTAASALGSSPLPGAESRSPTVTHTGPATVVPISGAMHEFDSHESAKKSGLTSKLQSRGWLTLFLASMAIAGAAGWVIHRGTANPAAPSPTLLSSANSGSSANREARELYQMGRVYWNKRTPDDLNKAVELFNRSLTRDPNYANAYVGLADCYNLLREFSAMPADVAFPRALASAKKAVELDPNSADAHSSLGFAMFSWNWDRLGAEREFQRALELDPGNARAHHWYATTLMALGRRPEAMQQIELAQKLDSSSAAVLADKGLILSVTGHRAESYALLHQVAEADPTLASAHSYLATLYWEDKDYPHYFDEAAQAARLQHNDVDIAEIAAAQRGFAAGGLPQMYARLLPLQQSAYQQGRGQASALADTYIHLGRRADSLRMLREAYERREQPILFLHQNSAFNELKGDPGFEEILRKSQQPRG